MSDEELDASTRTNERRGSTTVVQEEGGNHAVVVVACVRSALNTE